ncbi:MAG: hypothetical protein QOE51_4760 [Actinoplanes sp.]|jgi:hypothetical protein|nr:hypothetical protein [Actinoplanes sp.]
MRISGPSGCRSRRTPTGTVDWPVNRPSSRAVSMSQLPIGWRSTTPPLRGSPSESSEFGKVAIMQTLAVGIGGPAGRVVGVAGLVLVLSVVAYSLWDRSRK